MMDVFDAISSRRSVKKFKSDPVARDVMEKILEAGLWAPSGQNLQPVRFFVVTEPSVVMELEASIFALGSKLRKLLPLLKLFVGKFRGEKGPRVFKSLRETIFNGAPALILIGADTKSSTTYEKDCTLASMNMMLAAHALGAGSCYIGWTVLINRMKDMKKKLGIPDGVEIVDGLVVGYPAADRNAPKRRPVGEVTTWTGGES